MVAKEEIKIIPAWAWIMAGVPLIAGLWFFVITDHSPGLPLWARLLAGLLCGIFGGAYVLLIGYINRDAKRRGMSPTLWTIVAVIIPNALGIILYFVLRLSFPTFCPQCGHTVQAGFSFCPNCSCKLSPSCPQCQRAVGPNATFCPYCGTAVHNPAA